MSLCKDSTEYIVHSTGVSMSLQVNDSMEYEYMVHSIGLSMSLQVMMLK